MIKKIRETCMDVGKMLLAAAIMLAPMDLAIIAEYFIPLQGAWFVFGTEASLLVGLKILSMLLLSEMKKDLAELKRIYDETTEDWDEYVPYISRRKINMRIKFFRLMPLIYNFGVSLFQGIRFLPSWFALLTFIIAFPFIPSIIRKLARIIGTSQYIKIKISSFKQKES